MTAPASTGHRQPDDTFVSIVVPCRNERAFIVACLDSILQTTWRRDRLEVLVVDGMSDDGTRALLAQYAVQHPEVRMLDNPQRITPVALNIGIVGARGNVIVRMDAHNFYPSDYIPRLVSALFEFDADNVGGLWITKPGNASLMARAIALALAHPFGVGNAHYRLGVTAPRWVDTVPFGCYRREVFDRIGFFDEELVRNQDDEFNLRLIRSGGRILLLPDVTSEYNARESLAKLWRMYWQYGLFKPLVIRKVQAVMTLRQVIPALFVCALVCGAILSPFSAIIAGLFALLLATYVIANGIASMRAARGQPLGVKGRLMLIFPTIHLAYGSGFLRGLLRAASGSRVSPAHADAVPITR